MDLIVTKTFILLLYGTCYSCLNFNRTILYLVCITTNYLASYRTIKSSVEVGEEIVWTSCPFTFSKTTVW